MQKNKKMSFKSKVGENITVLAGPKSTGKCALFVRQAIQKAKDVNVEPTGIESAKDYGPWLIKQGYKASSKSYTSATTGDVAVMEGSNDHKHGHIQIYCSDKKWRSDFVQKGFYPYADGSQPKYVIYE